MENKIKYYRVLNDITQEELAKKVGCTRQTINAVEKDKYAPSLLLGFKIAEALDVEITELFQYRQVK